MRRTCSAINAAGLACRAAATSQSEFCRMHDPEQAEAVAEGRRLGGARRRREATLLAAYELGDIGDVEGIRRILEIAVQDALGLEQSVARLRVIIHAVRAAMELLRLSDHDVRISALERDRVERNAMSQPLAGLLERTAIREGDQHAADGDAR